MQLRKIKFDGQSVSIGHPPGAAESLLDFLFLDLETAESTVGDGEAASFRIHRDQDDVWELRRDELTLFRGRDINGLGNVLIGEVLFCLIENNQGGMAIHAGLVSGSQGAWLLPADSGSGKTSVTTWLLTRGYNYHTDELVVVNLEKKSLTPFTRPLNVKASGRAAIDELIDLERIEADIRTSGMVTMIPHRSVNPVFTDSIPALSAIVYPHFSLDSEAGMHRLSGAEAGLELMRSNVIARNLPGHGFGDVVSLVRHLPAFRLHYRHFDELAELFAQIH